MNAPAQGGRPAHQGTRQGFGFGIVGNFVVYSLDDAFVGN